MPRVTVICGGVGAARFLRGLLQVVEPSDVTAIVNVGDDSVLHGLEVSPDLDTITYTLAGAIDPDRGWGLVDETWHAMEQVRRYAEASGIDSHDEVGNDAARFFYVLRSNEQHLDFDMQLATSRSSSATG